MGDHRLQPLEEEHREGKGWQEHARRHGERAQRPARDIAHKGREDHQRRRQHPCQSYPVQKGRIADPPAPDRVGTHIGDRRIGAAKGQQSAFQPGNEQHRQRRWRVGDDRPGRTRSSHEILHDHHAHYRHQQHQHRHNGPLRRRIGQSPGQQDDPEWHRHQRRDQRHHGYARQQTVLDNMLADPHHRARNHRQHDDLHAEQHTGQPDMPGDPADIQPARNHHQRQTRQHESQPCQQSADASARHHAQMDAQFMRFGSGQHLQHRQQPVEACRRDPALFLDQRLAHHRNLRNRPAKGERAKT